MCYARLCQHRGFVGCCFGGGKSYRKTKGNTVWSSHGGIRKVYECNRCDGWKANQGDGQFFGRFFQEVD